MLEMENESQRWLLYRQLVQDMPILHFKRQVVLQLLNLFGTPAIRPDPSPSYSTSGSVVT